MNELAVVADTSVLIHFMEGHQDARKFLLGHEVHISVATEIELLTLGSTKRNAEEVISQVLNMCTVWDLNPSIKDYCVWLRSSYRLKLADSMVAATAASLTMPLLTSDKHFNRLKDVIDVRLLKA